MPLVELADIGDELVSIINETTSKIPSDSDVANYDAAFSWGNHADAGYIDSIPGETFTFLEKSKLEKLKVSVQDSDELALLTIDDVDSGDFVHILSKNTSVQRVASDGYFDFSNSTGIEFDFAKDVVTPFWFNAIGDGVADDTVPLRKAINFARERRLKLDGLGATYKITEMLTEIPYIVDNITIDASSVNDVAAWEAVAAAYETPKPLTADALQGSRLFNCTAHGYSVGDIVLILADNEFETNTHSLCGHWGVISAVTTDTFTTSEATLCNLETVNNAEVMRLPKSPKSDVNIKMIGGPNCEIGFRGFRFTDLTMTFIGENFNQRGLSLGECYAPHIKYVSNTNATASTTGYSFVGGGCGWIQLDKAVGHRTRHVATFGNTSGIPTIGATIGNVIGYECLSAPLDTHPGCLGVTQTGKTICDMSNEYVSEDGMVWQGVGGSFDVEFIGGKPERYGVLLQPFHVSSAFEIAPSYSFRAKGINTDDHGAVLALTGAGDVTDIELEVEGRCSTVFLLINLGATQKVESIRINGSGKSASSRAMQIQCNATTDLGFVSQQGNWVAGGNEASYILGSTDGATRRTKWSFSNGQSIGGTYGIRSSNKVDNISGAVFLDGSSGDTAVTGGGTVTVLS